MKTTTLLGIIAIVLIGGALLWYAGSREDEETDRFGQDLPGDGVLREITMESGDFFFSPDTILARRDEYLRIHFQNEGEHTFTIDELGVNETLEDSEEIITFRLPDRDGTYTFYSSVSGEREQGMTGTLIIGTGGDQSDMQAPTGTTTESTSTPAAE